MASGLTSKPSLIEFNNLRFLIMDAPKDSNVHLYIKECKKHNVVRIARISEPSYNKEEFVKAGIDVEECFFVDGASPPDDVIRRWNDLVSRTFDSVKDKDKDAPCIAVHCVAGLGRAPVLVAIALIEYGKDAVDAVSFIRERRRGAINAVQLAYLESYKPSRKSGKSCTLM